MDKQTFTYTNWRSPRQLIGLSLLIIPAIVLISRGISVNDMRVVYVGLFPLAIAIPLILFSLTTKITFDSSGIEYSSWQKRIFIEWKAVKSVGGYRIERYSVTTMPASELEKFSLWGQPFIYLSTTENYHLKWGQKTNNSYIDFHYRRELLDLVEESLKPTS